MSNTVFDFQAIGPFGRPSSNDTVATAGNFGVTVTRPDNGPYGVYRAEFGVHVPGPGIATGTNRTTAEWFAFLRTVQGAYDTFLWKEPLVPFLYSVAKTDADGFLGTSGGSSTDYDLAHRFIDASTLLVYVDDVLQTLTTHYTLEDNNTDQPYVSFVSPPGIGLDVTVAYEFYHPVRFESDPDDGDWIANTDVRTRVAVVEEYSGAHRA